MSLLRIAAIDFLNPAPLMWNFEHAPEQERLLKHYTIEKMTPAACAAQLGRGEADLGLIPIAAYAALPDLAIVPGCTIASLGKIRSILLVLRAEAASETSCSSSDSDPFTTQMLPALRAIRSVALDTASRTSALYTRLLFRKYWQHEPAFRDLPAGLDAMLKAGDAALLIGDPALLALEDRAAREARTGERLIYLDLGHAWQQQTGVPWVSAFWAARSTFIADPAARRMVCDDLLASRVAGLAYLPALASEWSSRLHLPLSTVQTYLIRNIHYVLDEACLRGITRFYADANECDLIGPLPELRFL